MPLRAGGHLGQDKMIEKYAAGCTGEGTCIYYRHISVNYIIIIIHMYFIY